MTRYQKTAIEPSRHFLCDIGFEQPAPGKCAQSSAADVALDVGELLRIECQRFVEKERRMGSPRCAR